jgi:hypothetical protein
LLGALASRRRVNGGGCARETSPEPADLAGRVRRTTQMVRVARRYHFAKCLSHTLTLWAMLRRQGIQTEVRIGVRSGRENKIEAHAWLEWQGDPLTDPGEADAPYRAFDRPVPIA